MDNWRINHLFSLLKEDPKDEFVHFAIAQEYNKNEAYDKAIEYYEKLKELNQQYVGLYYHLAATYAEIEEEEKALKTYEEGIIIANALKDLHALSELKNAKLNYEMEL